MPILTPSDITQNIDFEALMLAGSVIKTGDVLIVRNNESPGSEYLPGDGSTYLKTAYPDLALAIGGEFDPQVVRVSDPHSFGIKQEIFYSETLNLYVGLPISSSTPAAPVYSSDGITWTNSAFVVSLPAGLSTLAYSPEREEFIFTDGLTVCKSVDGINWTATATIGAIAGFRDIKWVPEKNFYVGVGGRIGNTVSPQVGTSLDGITWTLGTTPLVSLEFVVYSPTLDLFIAHSPQTAIYQDYPIQKSTDGLNWSPLLGISPYVQSIVWSPVLNKFFATGNFSELDFMSSADGVNWLRTTLPFNAYSSPRLFWVGGDFNLLAMLTSAGCHMSYDGEQWFFLNDIKYVSQCFFYHRAGLGKGVFYSSNGFQEFFRKFYDPLTEFIVPNVDAPLGFKAYFKT